MEDSQDSLSDSSSQQREFSSHISYNANASYLSNPVKQTFSGLLGRLNSENSTRNRSTSSYPSSLSNMDAYTDSNFYTPPQATTPTFQPPPLTRLTLKGFKSSTPSSAKILSRLIAEEIRLLLPARLEVVADWRLIFSLEQDGASLSTLYEKSDAATGKRSGFVLVVKDAAGGIFGAYLTDPPQPSNGHFYGNGECFLWRATTLPLSEDLILANLPPPPSEDTTHAQRMTTIGSPTSPKHSKSHRQQDSRHSSMHTQSHPAPPPPPPQPEISLLDMDPNEGEEWGEMQSAPSGNHNTASTNNHTNATANNHDTYAHVHESLAPMPAPASMSPTPSTGRTPSPPPSEAGISLRFKAFPYSGTNDYLIFCEQGFLSVGGGDGHYGLWLDGGLERGVSERCLTFGNEGLSDEGSGFDVLGVEVWGVGV